MSAVKETSNIMKRHRRPAQAVRAWWTSLRRFIRQLQREGRCLMDVKGYLSERVVVTLAADGHRHKILQIIFAKDGSFYVTFPYFKHTDGLLAEVAVKGPPGAQTVIDLAEKGKVASHLVKYSHHADGQAHFSQDGKVKTVIRRQSVPLAEQEGHIFTLIIQGLRTFESVSMAKEKR